MATRYAAFLRAVNLGSTRQAPSDKLVAAFEEAGFEEVATFRTSGNVAFTAPKKESEAKLIEGIEEGLREALGFEVPVFIRTGSQLRTIASKRPFPARAVDGAKGKVQVALLSGTPPAAAKKRVMSLASEQDRLTLDGSELYWLPSGGTQQSKLNMKAIDTALGTNTLRTQGTLEAMCDKYF